jgi:SRSO17 transposase
LPVGASGSADGPTQRIRDGGNQPLPGEEAWVVGEQRSSGERKDTLANLPADTDIKTLACAIKARRSCGQAHQRRKEELGLGPFEGRSWTGLHRHALPSMIAYAFLQHRRLDRAKQGKPRFLAAAPAEPARHPDGHRRSAHTAAPAPQMPPLPTMDQTTA